MAYGSTYTWYVEGVQSDGTVAKSLEWQFSTHDQPSERHTIRVQGGIWDFFLENEVSFHVEFHDAQAHQKLQHIWVEGPGIGIPIDITEHALGIHSFHHYHWLEDRYQLLGGEAYTLRMVYDGLADEVIIVDIEDAQHHFVNILQPQDGQIFDTPQEIRVEWDLSHDRGIRDEHFIVEI